MIKNKFTWAAHLVLAGILLVSCSHKKTVKMTKSQSEDIIREIKQCYSEMTEHSTLAHVDAFLSYYDSSLFFLSISAEGKMSNYDEFRDACRGYYNSIKGQRVTTIREEFNVLSEDLVLMGWTGNIVAEFKNGDTVKMNNYSITSLFKKINGKWKIIHDHESALPPVVIKK